MNVHLCWKCFWEVSRVTTALYRVFKPTNKSSDCNSKRRFQSGQCHMFHLPPSQAWLRNVMQIRTKKGPQKVLDILKLVQNNFLGI